jgi:hypothetical protein
MSGIEHAAGGRAFARSSPFPADWGPAPDNIEERARWIRLHAERAVSRRHRLNRERLDALERRARRDGPR